MTELVEDFIDIAYEVRSTFANVTITNGTTNLDLIRRVLSNEKLLAELANRTALTATYINETIYSIYMSAEHIKNAFNLLSTLDDDEKNLMNAQTNFTSCDGRWGGNNLVISSFLPAIIIIIILSFVNTRLWKRGCCGGRPGLAIPVNLLDSYEDRYTYSFAFAATASSIVNVIVNSDFTAVLGEGMRDVQNESPSYVKALLRILAAIVIGISYYPFFACISTHQRLLGAVMGAIYSGIWFLTNLFRVIDCADAPENLFTTTETVLLHATAILFHGLLLLSFLRVLIRSLISKRRGMVVSEDEWKENYKYLYVKKLLKAIPKSNGVVENGLKQKVISNVYRWKPDFKYSTRIICIYVTGGACLYLVVISYFLIGRYLKLFADSLVDSLEENDRNGRAAGTEVDWDRVRDGVRVTIICWMVSIGIAVIKDFAMMGNMLSWYRGHVLRLQRGDRSFLPYNMDNQAPVDIMVASFKFAGYQAGYIIWGFIITQIVLFLILTAIALGFIWPLTWGGLRNAIIPGLLVSLWPTIMITLITILVQKLMAKFLFLRDNGAMLALNNRRLFHIASYFFFFLNIFVGLFSCLIRIFYAILFGALFLPRLQKSALPRDWELFDPGYKTYIGYLFLEHTHTNPVLFTFNRLMREVAAQSTDACAEQDTIEDGIELLHKVPPPPRAKIRWFLALTLINNPQLVELRRHEEEKTAEEKKNTCIKIKEFTTKVARKIDAIRENHEKKHDCKL